MERRRWFNPRFIHPERRRFNNWALVLFGAAAMFLLFQRFVIGVGIVADRSMLPTLPQKTTFLINKYIYHFTAPQRGDVVVFRAGPLEKEWYVKRVIGLPGEEIAFDSGRVLIDGKPLKEPYTSSGTYPNAGPIRIGPESYFVLGDNRQDSEDSRVFGAIRRDRIEGKIKPGSWFPLR